MAEKGSLEDLLGPEEGPGKATSLEDLLGPDPDQGSLTAKAALPVGPAQMSGYGREPALAGSNLLSGGMSLLGLPGAAEGLIRQHMPGVGLGRIMPNSREVQAMTTDKLGLTNRPDLQPQGLGERLLAGTSRGVGAALPMALAPGLSLPAAATEGAVSGALGEGADMIAPGNTPLAIGAGVAGGLTTSAGLSRLASYRAGKVADQLGSSQTLQEAGSRLQDSARSWLSSDLPKLQAAAWAPVDSAIPGTTQVPTVNFARDLAALGKNTGILHPVSDTMSSPLVKKLQDAMTKVTDLQQMTGTQATWADTKNLRSVLGEALSNPQVIKDIPAAQLSSLYAGLTRDMRMAAHQVSPEAAQAFDSANEQSQKLYQFAQGPLSKVVSGTKPDTTADPNPETVVSRLLAGAKKGGTDLQALRTHLPDAMDEVASAHLRQNNFDWNKLSPEAQQALVTYPGHQKLLSNSPTNNSSKATLGDVVHAISTFGGGTVGAELGTGLGALVAPNIHPQVAGAMGALAGLALPATARYAGRTARNTLRFRDTSLPASTLAGSAGGDENGLQLQGP